MKNVKMLAALSVNCLALSAGFLGVFACADNAKGIHAVRAMEIGGCAFALVFAIAGIVFGIWAADEWSRLGS